MAKSYYTGVVLAIITALFSGISGAAPRETDSVMPPDSSTSPDARPSSDPFISHAGDLSIPFPTRFSWKIAGTNQSRTFDMYLSEDAVLDSTRLVASKTAETTMSVWNLKIGTRYFWKLTLRDNDAPVRDTKIFSFSTPLLWPRMIYVDGATNMRDIGGRKNSDSVMIRQGLFYRMAAFDQNPVITAKGIQQIMDLGIIFEIDLRFDSENPMKVLPPQVRYFRPPNPNGGGLNPYQYGMQNNGDQYRDVFREIAKPENYPMISHCMFGADREGTVVALLEALLGCSEQQMAVDYIWTSLSPIGIRDSAGGDWRGLISEIKSYDPAGGSVLVGACNYFIAKGLNRKEIIEIQKIFLRGRIPPFPDTPAVVPVTPSVIHCYATRKYLSLSGTSSITIKQNIERLEIYDILGKKIWKFRRGDIVGEYTINLPRYTGVAILHFSE
jgi:hypothetical protein